MNARRNDKNTWILENLVAPGLRSVHINLSNIFFVCNHANSIKKSKQTKYLQPFLCIWTTPSAQVHSFNDNERELACHVYFKRQPTW